MKRCIGEFQVSETACKHFCTCASENAIIFCIENIVPNDREKNTGASGAVFAGSEKYRNDGLFILMNIFILKLVFLAMSSNKTMKRNEEQGSYCFTM